MGDSEEKGLYLANDIIGAKRANQLVRNHWGIENKNHYVRDVSFFEYSHKIRKISFHFAILASMALNFFRYNKLNKMRERKSKC